MGKTIDIIKKTRTVCSQYIVCALDKLLGLNYHDLVKVAFLLCGGAINIT